MVGVTNSQSWETSLYSFVFTGWQFPSLISKFISFSLFLWWLWDDQYLCHYFLTEAFIIHPSCLCEQLLLLCCHWSFSSLFYLYLANTFCNLSHYLLIPFSSEGLSPDITFPRSSSNFSSTQLPSWVKMLYPYQNLQSDMTATMKPKKTYTLISCWLKTSYNILTKNYQSLITCNSSLLVCRNNKCLYTDLVHPRSLWITLKYTWHKHKKKKKKLIIITKRLQLQSS